VACVGWDFSGLRKCRKSELRLRAATEINSADSLLVSIPHAKEIAMSDHHTYKKVELVGSSASSIEDAINNALAEANKSIKHLEWFEVVDTRGHIKDGKAAHFQVTLKVGFRIASS
jgi:flavin-binding protein dodecin